MQTDKAIIRKGEILCIETGQYSDRYIVGHFCVLRDIPYAEWNEIRAAFYSEKWRDVSAHGLTGELVRRGLIEDADCVREIHADDVLGET